MEESLYMDRHTTQVQRLLLWQAPYGCEDVEEDDVDPLPPLTLDRWGKVIYLTVARICGSQ